MSQQVLQKYINSCTLTFKAFEHEVNVSKNRANLWHFTSISHRQEKKYMVYCAPNLAKVKSLIKVALKKLPKGTRLVVVCKEYSDDDYSDALEMGYCLVTMGTLRQYGSQMLEISSGSDSLPQTA
jgi:hypothetical protein